MTSCRTMWILLIAGWLTLSLACHEVHIDFDKDDGNIALYDDLYSVSVIDDQNAVAVGYYGAAYYTEDGGETWSQGETGTRSSLYNVSMADKKNGWAVGQRALLLRTEDGGRTWTRQPNIKEDFGAHFFSVSAIDKDTAWVIGEWGTRMVTRDGGKTFEDHSFTIDEMHPMFVWLDPPEQERVRSGEPVFEDVTLSDVQCERGDPQSARCWIIGEFGYIYFSDDGGQNWQKSKIEGSATMPLLEVAYNEIEISDDQVNAVTEFAQEVVPEEHLNVAIESVASAKEIEVLGRGGDPNDLFELLEARAQDVRVALEAAGVSTDRVRLRAQPPWDYEDYLEDDPDFLERFYRGRVRETGGVAVRVIQNPILFTVAFEDEENGLIAGLGGVVMRSEDGGETWRYRKMDLQQAVFSAVNVGGDAVAVGEKGFFRVSPDGGDTWGYASDGTAPRKFTFMRDVGFEPDGNVGYVVGQTGMVLRSTDAGKNWVQVLPPPKGEG